MNAIESYPAKADRTWDVLSHLAGLLWMTAIPFGNVLGPLVIWLIKKDYLPSVDLHGKEVLNFQISMTIYAIVAGFSILLLVGIVLLPLVLLLNIIFPIIGAVKASNGEFYRYPLTIRFIK